MDPLSISASAAALITICVQSVQLIKRTIETLKNAKKELSKLLNYTERLRLLLEHLRSLTHQLGHRKNTLLLHFDDAACCETINELSSLAHRIAKVTSLISLQFLMKRDKAETLVQRIVRHEEEIQTVLISIAVEAAIRTEDEVRRLSDKAISQAEPISVFESSGRKLTGSPPSYSTQTTTVKPSSRLQIWHGQVSRSQYDRPYLEYRDNLSDSAYAGNWDKVFGILENAESYYGQSFVNCFRLGTNPSQLSGWTPLHQAVYLCATVDDVKQLLEYGALRTLSTMWTNATQLPYRQMTPVEMAHFLGYSHLYNILAPVIRYNVPLGTLALLQKHLHSFMWKELEDLPERAHLRLPELVVLTELEVPELWFPLCSPQAKQTVGYMIRLDGRELLVKSYGIVDLEEPQLYRISEEDVYEIKDAVTFETHVR